MKTQLSAHTHAEGKLSEIMFPQKQFWNLTAEICHSIILNNWNIWGFVLKGGKQTYNAPNSSSDLIRVSTYPEIPIWYLKKKHKLDHF